MLKLPEALVTHTSTAQTWKKIDKKKLIGKSKFIFVYIFWKIVYIKDAFEYRLFYWKHYSKIIFKFVNSDMGPIFNESFVEKKDLYYSWDLLENKPQTQSHRMLLKKKKKRGNAKHWEIHRYPNRY